MRTQRVAVLEAMQYQEAKLQSLDAISTRDTSHLMQLDQRLVASQYEAIDNLSPPDQGQGRAKSRAKRKFLFASILKYAL